MRENSSSFFANTACRYYPCHQGMEELNCLFCYCPLYLLEDCPGTYTMITRNGRPIKNCTSCTFPHKPENYAAVLGYLRKAVFDEKETGDGSLS